MLFSYQGEMYSYATVIPYTDVQARDLVSYLESGKRLEQPSGCPDQVYALMQAFWRLDPAARLSFSQVSNQLEALRVNEHSAPRDIGALLA